MLSTSSIMQLHKHKLYIKNVIPAHQSFQTRYHHILNENPAIHNLRQICKANRLFEHCVPSRQMSRARYFHRIRISQEKLHNPIRTYLYIEARLHHLQIVGMYPVTKIWKFTLEIVLDQCIKQHVLIFAKNRTNLFIAVITQIYSCCSGSKCCSFFPMLLCKAFLRTLPSSVAFSVTFFVSLFL